MAYWLVYEPDGRFHQIISDEKPEGDVEKVDRHTLDPHCEHYDRKTKKWVKDHEKRSKKDEEVSILMMSPQERYTLLANRISVLEELFSLLTKK